MMLFVLQFEKSRGLVDIFLTCQTAKGVNNAGHHQKGHVEMSTAKENNYIA